MRRGTRQGAVGLVVTTVLMCGQPAIAAEVAKQSTALVNQPIPAQAVDSALAELSRQTGLQIVYMSRVADRVKSSAVPSGLPSDEALRRLLADTGLDFEFLDHRTVTILPSGRVSPNSWSAPRGAAERGAGRSSGSRRSIQALPLAHLRRPRAGPGPKTPQ